ncbi:MAG TPA: inorganic diphosphatase [Trueperaceae bacterium]|nr:inorganic diphosphatase [Trueperaceae bacterium]
MSSLIDMSPGEQAPHAVNAVVEVPFGSSNKYEYDPQLGVFRLDRVLYSPMHYPGDYGFIPGTLADDGDPVDILVLMTRPTFPGAVIRARPLGYLEMSDEKGRDQKVLAVPVDDPRYDSNRHLDTVSRHRLREIEHFFAIYKELEGKETHVDGWHGMDETHALIRSTIEAYEAPRGSDPQARPAPAER